MNILDTRAENWLGMMTKNFLVLMKDLLMYT